MLRDNLAGLIEPMLSSAGAYPLALATDRKELSDDRPQYALKIPARQGGIYALTENVASPFHAEPRQTGRLRTCGSSGEVTLAADSICQPCVCSDTYNSFPQFESRLCQ